MSDVGPGPRHVVERSHLVRGDLFENGTRLCQIRLVAQYLEELRRSLHVLGRRRGGRRLEPAYAKLRGDAAQIAAAPARPSTPWFGMFPRTKSGIGSPFGLNVSLTLPALISEANTAMPGAPVSKRGICH
jgi:hypothetical protein